MQRIFNVKTFCAKFLSCVTAIGSGMPIGPEGPMIHLGWVFSFFSNSAPKCWIGHCQNSSLSIQILVYVFKKNKQTKLLKLYKRMWLENGSRPTSPIIGKFLSKDFLSTIQTDFFIQIQAVWSSNIFLSVDNYSHEKVRKSWCVIRCQNITINIFMLCAKKKREESMIHIGWVHGMLYSMIKL